MADLIAVPFSWRLANALVSYAKYLLLTFWPIASLFTIRFLFQVFRHGRWSVALFMLAAITAVALREARRRPYLITGWLWFLGTLVPVIGLVRVGAEAMADRYTYIPSIGLFVALVFGLADLANTWRIGRVPIASASAMTILLLGSLTAYQISWWRDSETLFERTLSVTSDNAMVQYNLGCALYGQGKICRSHSSFRRSSANQPNDRHALTNMGMALRKQGKAAEAIGFYERALRVKPDSAKVHGSSVWP